MNLKKTISKLPTTSGVYIFRDLKKRIIYIGKAVNLRARVRSYFQDVHPDAKTNELVKNIAGLEHIKTGSEVEALLLESELIKRYKPKYNVQWRDDKNYVYIKVTSEDYPQVSLVRQIVDDKARYIGPFVSAGAVRGLLRYIRKIFMFRHCSYDLKEAKGVDSRRSLSAEAIKDKKEERDSSTRRSAKSLGMTEGGGNDRRGRVCLQYSIGNCSGPCEKYITKTEYNKSIRRMVKLFQGKTKEIEKEFKREMKSAAKNEDFERAAVYRNRLMWLKKIKTIELDEDFDSGQARMTPLRRGFAGQARDKALVGLRDALDLGSIPQRIECYDISNIFGKAAVGSMVVFADGMPEKNHYRRFEIKTVDKISDTDMVREVLRRRFKKFLASDSGQARMTGERDSSTRSFGESLGMTPLRQGFAGQAGKTDESFQQVPDLIIIDGGKGQLSAAMKVLDEYGLKLNVVSLAKRKEEIFMIDSGLGQNDKTRKFQKISLSDGSESLYLVQRIRDEAHRFAITYHRSKRGKEMAVSNLDVVDGIGPKRKKMLLKSFGSVENIREASVEDLSKIVGDKLAKKIKGTL